MKPAASSLDALPAFRGCDIVPTLGGTAYRERWAPGSRARARLVALRAVGLAPTQSTVRVILGGVAVELAEIRVEPVPAAVPMVGREDLMPRTTTRAQRAVVARLAASVESED